jgi:hypothetical protein
MSIAFYDISELEAQPAPAGASGRRYRIEVVLDSRGRLVSAQADAAAAGLIEHLARVIDAGGVTR